MISETERYLIGLLERGRLDLVSLLGHFGGELAGWLDSFESLLGRLGGVVQVVSSENNGIEFLSLPRNIGAQFDSVDLEEQDEDTGQVGHVREIEREKDEPMRFVVFAS
ncbi:hypothetical protein ACFX13_025848 [Malus domestica]